MTHTEDVRRQWDGLEASNAARVADAFGAMKVVVISLGALFVSGMLVTLWWFALEPK